MKKCKQCGEEKPVEEFYKAGNAYQASCKVCFRAKTRENHYKRTGREVPEVLRTKVTYPMRVEDVLCRKCKKRSAGWKLDRNDKAGMCNRHYEEWTTSTAFLKYLPEYTHEELNQMALEQLARHLGIIK